MDAHGTWARQVFRRLGQGVATAALAVALVATAATETTETTEVVSVYPPGADVPPLGSAFVLPHAPQARMIDGSSLCELIAGVLPRGHRESGVAGGLYLYRWGAQEPFLHVATREDGLLIAHFEARPNERVLGRAYYRHPRNGQWIWTLRVPTTCRAGRVRAGELEPAAATTQPQGRF